MSYLSLAWAWVAGHPLYDWAVASALLSLLYTKLDSTTKGHAFLRVLAGAGIDLPTIIAAVKKIILGGGTASTSGGGNANQGPAGGATPPPAPPAATRTWFVQPVLTSLGMACLVGMLIVVTPSTGCTKQQVQQAVTNFTPAANCFFQLVLQGVTDPIAYLGCGAVTIDDVLTEVEDLLASDGGTSAVAPTAIQKTLLTLKANALALKAKDAGGQ